MNYLRNIALSQVNTPFVFMLDIDFLPAFDTYNYVRQMLVSDTVSAFGAVDKMVRFIQFHSDRLTSESV